MASGQVLRFDRFTLDLPKRCLHAGDRVGLKLRPKSFDVLRYLVENPGRVVSKDELASTVWPKVVVSDDSLVQCIRDVRAVLGDDGQRFIRTSTATSGGRAFRNSVDPLFFDSDEELYDGYLRCRVLGNDRSRRLRRAARTGQRLPATVTKVPQAKNRPPASRSFSSRSHRCACAASRRLPSTASAAAVSSARRLFHSS